MEPKITIRVAGGVSFAALIYIVSSLGSYPRAVPLGPLNLSSFMSLLLPFVAAGLILRHGSVLTSNMRIALPLGLLVVVMWTQTIIQMTGPLPRFENTPFLLTGIFLVFLAGGQSHHYLSNQQFLQIFHRAAVFCLIFVFVVAAFKDEDPATSQLTSLFLPIFLLSSILRQNVWAFSAVVLMLLQTVLLESRIVTIAVVAQIIWATYLLRRERPSTAMIVLIVLIFGMVGAAQVFDFGALVGGGDAGVTVGGVSINTAGRAYYWTVIFEAWLRSPIVGHGYSIAVEMFNVHRWSQPHNDYLRLLHYTGLVGFGAWILFLLLAFRRLLRTIKYARTTALTPGIQLVYIATLSTAGVAIMMLTDNTMVYSYIVYPWAILLGRAVSILPPRAE